MYFLGAKNGRKANLVSISFLKAWHVFFMMDLVFQQRAAVIVHVKLLHTSWRTLHYMIPLASLCLLKHDDKSKFTNMTHLICLGPNLF